MKRFVCVFLIVWGLFIGGLFYSLHRYSARPSAQGIIPQRQQAALLASGVDLRGVDLWALDNDNVLWLKRGCDGDFRPWLRVRPFVAGEQITGIDFRPSDGYLYALSDQGTVYQVMLFPPGQGTTVQVAQASPRFAGGVQSLMDFNPVLDALRLIGSSDENYALVNSGGNLNVTAVQTMIAYAPGDPAAGANPNLTGGAYTNNVVGSTTTLFYALDYDRDTLVTILPNASGSSATGGGQLTTIGRLRRADGTPILIPATADLDIYTDPATGANLLTGIAGRVVFTVDIGSVSPGQDVTVRAAGLNYGGLIDLAVVRTRGRC